MTDLLLIVAHPDDEVFGAGGTIARMTAYGKRVTTVTLTRGRAGRTLGLCPPEMLAEVRELELRAALAALGVQESHIWDYHDFVPDDSRGIPHHGGLAAADAAEISARLAAVIAAAQPRALLTFPPNGINGHPDHVATHQLARAAIARSGQAPALYYYASDTPYAGEARPGFLSIEAIRAQHLPPTHYVEVGEFIEAKLRAMGKHKTQALSVLWFMERFAHRLRVESFHRAEPAYPHADSPLTVPWLS